MQSTSDNSVNSYITVYKHNDSLYTYRLYNKDSLNSLHPITNESKNQLMNTQAVFGFFEKSINNVDSINVNSPVNATIKNVGINFGNNNSTTKINGNRIAYDIGGDCVFSISISIEYSLRIYASEDTLIIIESLSVSVTITIDCSGGGGGCSCGDITNGDNVGTGYGSINSSGNNNFWYLYGTGWPWSYNSNDANWQYFWTSTGMPSIPTYYDYAVTPFIWSFNGDDGTTFNDPDPSKQGDFKFDPADNYASTYPRFTNMVKNLKDFVKNNPAVMSALQKYSGFSKQQILDNLTYGQGPTIKVEEMNGRFAFYNKNSGPSTLHIRASYVRGLEQAYLPSTQQATAFLLGVCILHEFIHYGTTKNNISEGGYDFGTGFERDAFNVIVDDDNAGNVVLRFRQYF